MNWFATILLCILFIAGQNRSIQKDDYSASLRKLAFKTSKHPEEKNANIYFGKGKVSKRWFRGNIISYEREECLPTIAFLSSSPISCPRHA